MAARPVTGIIIRQRDFNESDRLLMVFTAEEGMVECLSRGVRKIKSKLGGKLQLFRWLRLQLAQNHGHWPTITAVDCLDNDSPKSAPAQDLRRFALLCALAEVAYLAHRAPVPGQDSVSDFAQFQQALALIQAGSDLPVLLSYTGNLLAESGYLVLPLQCARCGQSDQPLGYFTQGILTCRNCGGQQPLALNTTRALAQLLTATPHDLSQTQDTDLAASTELMKQLFEYHLDCQLKAWPLLTTLPAAISPQAPAISPQAPTRSSLASSPPASSFLDPL